MMMVVMMMMMMMMVMVVMMVVTMMRMRMLRMFIILPSLSLISSYKLRLQLTLDLTFSYIIQSRGICAIRLDDLSKGQQQIVTKCAEIPSRNYWTSVSGVAVHNRLRDCVMMKIEV